MDPPPTISRIVVYDTNALVESADMIEDIKTEVHEMGNRIVIPRKVMDELHGLAQAARDSILTEDDEDDEEGNGGRGRLSTGDKAIRVLKFLTEECGLRGSSHNGRGARPNHAADPILAKHVRLQRPEEHIATITQLARSADTHIVSCAVFQYYVSADEQARRAASRGDASLAVSQRVCALLRAAESADEERFMTNFNTTRLIEDGGAVLVTNDTIMRIKARAYHIPALSHKEWQHKRLFLSGGQGTRRTYLAVRMA